MGIDPGEDRQSLGWRIASGIHPALVMPFVDIVVKGDLKEDLKLVG